MSKLRSACWIGLVWMAACSDVPSEPDGNDPGTTSPPPAQVVVDTAPASATDCPHGGSIVLSGIDDNHNHQLDEGEIRNRTPVCDAAAPTVVVRIVAEPAGDGRPCPHGGTAVQSGPDTNANGALDDDEVANTDLLCGALLATRFRAEPAGAHCSDGGIAFEVGPDANDNGVLDNGEIKHTDFSCGDIVARSVTVGSAADAAALAHVRVIAGQLAVTAADSVALPDLEHLIGDLAVVDNARLAQLRMARLADISGALRLRNAAQLAALALPLLTRIDGDLELRRLAVLPDMNGLFGVTHLGGAVTIDDNAALASVHLPVAGPTGALAVTANPKLAQLNVFGGSRLGPVTLQGNGLLSAMISTSGDLAAVTVADNPKLAKVTLFSRALGSLKISGNAVLGNVDVSLTEVDGDIVTGGNPQLARLHLGTRPGGQILDINGSLVIADPVSEEPVFGAFRVTGDYRLSGTQQSLVGSVLSVGGSLILENNPVLTFAQSTFSVGADVVVSGNPLLDDVDFLDNAVVQGSVVIRDNAHLRLVSALDHAIRVAGDLVFENNPKLVGTSTAGLTAVDGKIRVAGNPKLPALSFGALGFASGLEVADNAALAAVALPEAGVISTISIHGNTAAQHLAMPQLQFTSAMTVDDNPQLPSCEITAVFRRIETPPSGPDPELEQHGNDDIATCSPTDGT